MRKFSFKRGSTDTGGNGSKMPSKHSCCGFHIMSVAAVCGILQLLAVSLVISKTATIYSHRNDWHDDEGVKRDLSTTSFTDSVSKVHNAIKSLTGNGTVEKPEQHSRQQMEMTLSDTITTHVVWLLCLGFYAMAFRHHKAVMVIPDIVILIIVLIWGIVMIAQTSVEVAEAGQDYKDKEDTPSEAKASQRLSMAIAFLVYSVVFWVVEFIFAFVSFKFYRFLKEAQSSVRPNSAMLPAIFYPVPPSAEVVDEEERRFSVPVPEQQLQQENTDALESTQY